MRPQSTKAMIGRSLTTADNGRTRNDEEGSVSVFATDYWGSVNECFGR
jgi:hypothetical protein